MDNLAICLLRSIAESCVDARCRDTRTNFGRQEGQGQTKHEWGGEHGERPVCYAGRIGHSAYGTRHIAISCAQYKANGYKPALEKLMTKSRLVRISPRFGLKPRPAAKGETSD